MQVDLFSLDSEGTVGSMEVPDHVYGIMVPRSDLLHRYVLWQLAKRRSGTHKTKDRSEVSYSGRKIYRQKGTGRARHGDRGAGLFRHGGVVKGPVNRSHEHSLPKKVRRLALRHAISNKFISGKAFVLDKLLCSSVGSSSLNKKIDAFLDARGAFASADNEVGADVRKVRKNLRSLFIDGSGFDEGFLLSSKNLKGIDVLPTAGLNVVSLLKCDFLFVTVAALEKINERLG